MNIDYQPKRTQLINSLRAKGVSNEDVLAAMQKVPRELFVAPSYKEYAYVDYALPIEEGQTISQPFIVALMTQCLLADKKLTKVLEIGTGSGYQAAILSQLVAKVFTVERIQFLYNQAQERFQQLQYDNIFCKYDDGRIGWPEEGPFDGILVTAAATEIPLALLDQLADGGRLLLPLGEYGLQKLILVTRKGKIFEEQVIEYVVFVPLLSGKQEL